MKKRRIPGMVRVRVKEAVPYSAAGISPDGDLFVLSTKGETPSEMLWSNLSSQSRRWRKGKISMKRRFCYTYVFSSSDGAVYLVSNRDVRWGEIGFKKPDGAFV